MAGEKDKHNGGYKSKMLGTTNTVSRPIVTQVSSREGLYSWCQQSIIPEHRNAKPRILPFYNFS